MMPLRTLQYWGKLKERADVLFAWMELYLFTFHYPKNWYSCNTDGSWREKHKYRKMKRHFDNTVEKDCAPKRYAGKLLFEMIKNIQVVFGKGTVKVQKRKKTPTSTHIPFKK
jgi:hypothetical protein